MEAGSMPPVAYADPAPDLVRERLEVPWLARLAEDAMSGHHRPRVLELGCGSGVGCAMAAVARGEYVGVDLRSPGFALPGPHVEHDLREGLGPVGEEAFDLYLAGFGLASHLEPGELTRLFSEIAAHGRSGSVVVVEALGLYSIEWPRLWSTAPGSERALSYAMAREVRVHPWAPRELAALAERSGLRPRRVRDRTLQAGPKTGAYWPALPDVRAAMGEVLANRGAPAVLTAPLPPLPADRAALRHQELAAQRRRLVPRYRGPALARAIWSLERRSAGGFGHGLVLTAVVP